MKRKNRPFTLIELLVVIAIIIILVGLLLAALAAVRRKGDETQTRAAIEELTIGIEKYRSVHGRLPPVNTDAPSTTFPKYRTELLYDSLMTTKEGGPFCQLNDVFVKDGSSAGKRMFIDKWEKPIAYIPASEYTTSLPTTDGGTGDPDAKLIGRAAYYPNPLIPAEKIFYQFDTYQLRSGGKNELDDAGRKDDIQNFDVKK